MYRNTAHTIVHFTLWALLGLLLGLLGASVYKKHRPADVPPLAAPEVFASSTSTDVPTEFTPSDEHIEYAAKYLHIVIESLVLKEEDQLRLETAVYDLIDANLATCQP